MSYLRKVYRLPAALEDSLVDELWLAGTLLGVTVEDDEDDDRSDPSDRCLRLTAYFDLPAAVGLPLRVGETGMVECVAEEEMPEMDWMAEYRRRAVPFALGRTLLVDPREPLPPLHSAEPREPLESSEPGDPAALAEAGGRRLLRLPARTAFGIGSHESTFLAIELLEVEELAGRRVLDVGTGTGILAFAALVRGAAGAVAFDADPVAVFQARANSALNQLFPRLFAGRPAALSPRLLPAARFDLAVVNVVPEQILPGLAELLPALAPGGGLILSGLLAERAPEVLARLGALGLVESGRRQAGDWVALRLVRS